MKVNLLEVTMITQAIGAITIKGSDAPVVAAILSKLEKEYNRLDKIEKKKQKEHALGEISE
tara:strand:+ start:97 stop:279 length:183 start_codon:yes stop_codon:yes gene_type:complete